MFFCGFGNDVILATSLIWYFHRQRRGFNAETDNLLSRLARLTLSTALLTVPLMAVTCFSYFAMPHQTNTIPLSCARDRSVRPGRPLTHARSRVPAPADLRHLHALHTQLAQLDPRRRRFVVAGHAQVRPAVLPDLAPRHLGQGDADGDDRRDGEQVGRLPRR
jgi:hypothetical protein